MLRATDNHEEHMGRQSRPCTLGYSSDVRTSSVHHSPVSRRASDLRVTPQSSISTQYSARTLSRISARRSWIQVDPACVAPGRKGLGAAAARINPISRPVQPPAINAATAHQAEIKEWSPFGYSVIRDALRGQVARFRPDQMPKRLDAIRPVIFSAIPRAF